MEIGKDTVVTIEYTLTDADGTIIDSSKGKEPLSYIQGTGSIITGLEAALEGRSAGETFTVAIPPDQGYGERDDSLMQVLSRDRFPGSEAIEVGMQFQAHSESGRRLITVVGVEGNSVTVDGNHPLAGVTLNFDVMVVGVRAATSEELSHGHAHGPGGHDH